MKLANENTGRKRDECVPVQLRQAIREYVTKKYGNLFAPLESTGLTGGTNG